MKIAFIDDKADNLAAWRHGMEAICSDQPIELATFQSVDEFEEEMLDGYRPDIVFTDYHIDDRFGTEVVAILRQQFGSAVYIIAHSSQRWRNEHLLQLGADEILPKYKGLSPSPTVTERFWSVDDLWELVPDPAEE